MIFNAYYNMFKFPILYHTIWNYQKHLTQFLSLYSQKTFHIVVGFRLIIPVDLGTTQRGIYNKA